jgi:hypothetical protein
MKFPVKILISNLGTLSNLEPGYIFLYPVNKSFVHYSLSIFRDLRFCHERWLLSYHDTPDRFGVLCF